jgi:hypothetical protein
MAFCKWCVRTYVRPRRTDNWLYSNKLPFSGIRRTLNDLPLPTELPKKQKRLIEKLGKLWAENPERPRPKKDVRKRWEKLIEDWAETDSLPLYVRKAKGNRGWKIPHRTGRSLVPTDNSPATWVFVLACTDKPPTLRKIKYMVDEGRDLIPIAFVLPKAEQSEKGYKYTLTEWRKDHPNSRKYKFAHFEHVRLMRRGPLAEVDISNLKDRFKKLMNPFNMFVVRKEYSGLAELSEFSDQIRLTDDR